MTRICRTLCVLALVTGWSISLSAQIRISPASWINGRGVTRGSVTAPTGGAFRVEMALPSSLAATPSQSGTDLAAGVYAITVTAIDVAGGETDDPTAITCTVAAGGAGRCAVTWTASTGAASYRIWTSLVGVATPTRYFASTTNSYNLDTLTGATVATLPTSTAAYIGYVPLQAAAQTTVGVFSLANGTVAAPSLTFASEPRIGLWTVAASETLSLGTGTGTTGNILFYQRGVNYFRMNNGVFDGLNGASINLGGFYVSSSATSVGVGGTTSPDAPLDIVKSALAATPTTGSILQNETLSTAGVPVQMPPDFEMKGHVWNTTATAVDNTQSWFWSVLPVSGTTPSGSMRLGVSLNGGTTTFPVAIESTGYALFDRSSGGTRQQVEVNAGANDLLVVSYAGAAKFGVGQGGAFVYNSQNLGSVNNYIFGSSGTTGQVNLLNWAESAGVGLDFATDATLKVRTRAQTGDASVQALALYLGPLTGNAASGSTSIAHVNATIDMATATGTGTGTITQANFFPAGCVQDGFSARVTTILAGAGLTTWSIGPTADLDMFGIGLALAQDTLVRPATYTVTSMGQVYSAASDLVLTAAAGVFSTGVLKVTATCHTFTPIGS